MIYNTLSFSHISKSQPKLIVKSSTEELQLGHAFLFNPVIDYNCKNKKKRV